MTIDLKMRNWNSNLEGQKVITGTRHTLANHEFTADSLPHRRNEQMRVSREFNPNKEFGRQYT